VDGEDGALPLLQSAPIGQVGVTAAAQLAQLLEDVLGRPLVRPDEVGHR